MNQERRQHTRGWDRGPQPVQSFEEPDGCGSRSPTRRLFFYQWIKPKRA